jgi:hypothetical protein
MEQPGIEKFIAFILKTTNSTCATEKGNAKTD